MITENWKAIKGHEEYEVSDLGRIRKVLEDGTRKELSYGMANVGYAQVNFPDGPLMFNLSPSFTLSHNQLDTNPPVTRFTVISITCGREGEDDIL